jgi:DNA-binding NarL/FixJ family response regulator
MNGLSAAAESGHVGMKIRVVVADDFPLTRDGVVRSLQRDPGIEVVGVADDGDKAFAIAAELDPDVMVLDLRMPGVSGPALINRLTDELPRTRVLIVTASDSPENLLDCVAAGAAGYLSKRVTSEELRQAVITTHGGGSVVGSEFAPHLLREYSAGQRGDNSSIRPLFSPREMETLRLLSHGMTDNEIGAKLFISPRTVQNHLTNIRDKTGLRRRSELARWAVERAIA